ncbi:Nitrosoguanidine resistance protein SNG1 [Tolypocladium ophioglossoides CBS 100239]|uniref:Nitrosoguanidine resistance protein SNG1 n=1 Tax=Tolypocladium ophioglossoides (strain CBS 100239) TaxID=1163406 RepID=A0A0L0NED7_TOLOC|nr:Nitrosoguanidine resistance protein SNG1 [Tolypocladium ophioglossoides CBS 100239]
MLPSMFRRFYPRACDNRLPLSHPEVRVNRVKFFKAASLNFVLLLLLFFGLFCYMFGSLYQEESRTNNLDILWVDYDGGIIGDAVRDAYKSLQSNSFPTLVERPALEFPSESDLREVVCNTNYWAALYTFPRSSESLGLAIAGSDASQYNPSHILSYIWNEARYPTVMDSLISSNLRALSDGARVAYTALNGTAAFSTIPPNNPAAISAFATPWTLSSINIQPTTQGPRTVYNTIVIVLVLIQDFFYLGAINGLYVQFKIYTRITPTRIILVRDVLSGTFTMVGSLLITCAIWAFRANWNVSGTQFALNWLILWLFAHANFLTLDVFTIWIPPQYISMALISWVVINVTSIILPFDLSSPFYRWGYALPAHAAYDALTDNWSNGCSPHLYYALPVLFAYELSGLFWTSLGVYKRCHYAVITEETTQEAMRLRVEATLKLEREHDRRLGQEHIEESVREDENGESSRADKNAADFIQKARKDKEGEEADRLQAEKDIEELGDEIERMETRATRMANFGPSFHLVGEEME